VKFKGLGICGRTGAAAVREAPCLLIWETWCWQGLLAGVITQKGFKSGRTISYPFQSSLKYCQMMNEQKARLWPGYPEEAKLGTTQY